MYFGAFLFTLVRESICCWISLPALALLSVLSTMDLGHATMIRTHDALQSGDAWQEKVPGTRRLAYSVHGCCCKLCGVSCWVTLVLLCLLGFRRWVSMHWCEVCVDWLACVVCKFMCV